MTDLFTYALGGRYPRYKEPTTSKQAAASIDAPRLQRLCKAAFRLNGDSTADEIAAYLGLSVLTVRPRVTELHRLGAICRTGERRANSSGRSAHVYRVVA